MKRTFLILVLVTLLGPEGFTQYLIRGTVRDEKGEPISYANVYIEETLEGASSGEEGEFSFSTAATDLVHLVVRMLGYETSRTEIRPEDQPEVHVVLKPEGFMIEEVEVFAGNFRLGDSKWKTMNAVDIATTGGSVGDLYKSISTLPGNQIVGESGKLFIRGGESRESQTYIDDMHVLSPYTTTGENDPVRSRYSPFMFGGMTFSLGGYNPEYAQGLSSVLPLQTKDENPVSKLGFNPSSVGAALGGTYAFTEGSASMNMDYQNLGPYYSIVGDERDFVTPYNKLSGGGQFRFHPGRHTQLKVYAGYDHTGFTQRVGERAFQLKEDNYYLNTTWRHKTGKDYQLFAGAVYSYNGQNYRHALVRGDESDTRESEIHLKTKVQKRFSNLFKLQVGAESMIRSHHQLYRTQDETFRDQSLNHSINGMFATGSFYLTQDFNVALSSRLEYSTINDQWKYLPRIAFNYGLNRLKLSAIAGRYSQLSENNYLHLNRGLRAETCDHYLLSACYESHKRVYRLEGYFKKYDHLTTIYDGVVANHGNGYSKGIDLFFDDRELIPRLEYRVSYSLNLSERLYGEMPVKDMPQYASRHNAALSLRYDLPFLRSIIGITNRFASGRPYHDPNRAGYMNGRTPHYNSVDISWTVLAHKRVIVFASVSNLFNRKNMYNYTYPSTPDNTGHYQPTPVKNHQNQFFYVGVFITLAGKTAYDVANF
ncbi:MAG: TonB-dependent receptor [Tannerellaceae bacterium]|nr:TonB-dependent receptor [Tannerellaceae bacterium]